MSKESQEKLLICEVELLLAEKRTHLSIFRTGAALFGLSVSALSVVLVTADLSIFFVLEWPIFILLILVAIATMGGWQMFHARGKVKRLDALIKEIEKQNKRIAEIII